jgi:crossover junction endodeoxyribonuclease RuvC
LCVQPSERSEKNSEAKDTREELTALVQLVTFGCIKGIALPPEKTEKIIMGIDPGTTIMGYGIIRVTGKTPEMVTMGVIHLSKITDHALKLQRIFDRCIQLIDEYHPDEMAAEAPFFGQNVQSMLKLGRAQGVALAAALSRQIPVTEYAPRKIKQSITGNGAASKEQVAAMLCTVLKIKPTDLPKELDATDGLAAALCHHFQNGSITNGKGYTGWKAFLANNPERKK